jgi:hypothetical protein
VLAAVPLVVVVVVVAPGCVLMFSANCARSIFSCSIIALSALVNRGFRTVVCPRVPLARVARPPRAVSVVPRVVPPRPRPLARLIVPSALWIVSV